MSNSSLVNYTRISPNRTSPRNGKISKIVIHHMAGNLSVETCANVFAPTSRKASSHYGIGSDGRIGLYCPECDRAWTTGHQIDHQAVTIEVADDVMGNGWHSSSAAMKSLVLLCADICRRNGITNPTYTGNGNGTFLMHRWYQNTDCPGAYLESMFPWIAQEVRKALAGKDYTAPTGGSVSDPMSKGYLIKGDVGESVGEMQRMLIAVGYNCGTYGADKSFGDATENALKRFQKDNGLEVDGCYGSKSKAALTAKYKAVVEKNKQPKQVAGKAVNNEQLWYRAHCQTVGYLYPVHDGQVAGTTGYSKRLECLRIDLRKVRDTYPDAKLAAKVHIQGIGWKYFENVEHDTELGTTGQGKRIEAIELELTGVEGKDIYYRTHIAGTGWTGWIKGGFTSGTVGISKAIEAIQIKIE